MASNGIRDRVAIVGMGCTGFGERWDKSVSDLLVESSQDALNSANVPIDAVDAFWLGTLFSGQSGLTLSRPLKLDYKPVSRLENYCATGSEAFRNACYAVACGAYDMAMAIGVEKLKDSGISGLPSIGAPEDGTRAGLTAPATFSLLAPAYAKKYGVDDATFKEAMTRIAWKNHKNGALNPRAQFRKEVAKDVIACSPQVAGALGIFDCSGVSDGSAAAIIVRAEDAYKYTDKPLFVKALSFIAGPATGPIDPDYDYTTFPEVVASASDAYAQAGIKDPRAELAMAEVHDCFTPTELVLMEDLGFAPRGTAWKEVLNGTFDLEGELAVNPDGGLKSFGHPIGASGLRMLFEAWLQLRGEAGKRQIASVARGRKLALTHNLGGAPGRVRVVRLRRRLRAQLGPAPIARAGGASTPARARISCSCCNSASCPPRYDSSHPNEWLRLAPSTRRPHGRRCARSPTRSDPPGFSHRRGGSLRRIGAGRMRADVARGAPRGRGGGRPADGGRGPGHPARQRQGAADPRRSPDDLARLPSRDAAPHRHQEGLRSRAVRGVHRARERPPGELLPEPGRDARRGGDHDDRRLGHAGGAPPDAGRLRGVRRIPVRLLHVGPDHVGGGAARGAVRSRGRGREGADERQHLPLRGLSQHRGRDPAGPARAS